MYNGRPYTKQRPAKGVKSFEERIKLDPKPILFIFPGLTSYGQTPYILNIVIGGIKRGYDIAVVNHRGLGKGYLKSP